MDFSPNSSDQQTERYLRLLAQHDRWLATYVYSLVHDRADGDEILQDCKVAMWKHFGSFQADTNFRAWARKFATHHILNYRRSEKRRPETVVDDEFIEAVAGEIDRRGGVLDRRSDALQLCLRKLPEAHRRIIIWRYYEDCGIEEIAAKSERSVEAVYRLLSRIRTVLNDCVSQQLAQPQHP
ncbi:MAG TPA: sigma-70 family RNA polymerase sigma factor [Chthoniobacteraceae bacterium]|nr:sigma-70 family RNA polymerase sigma factor [Chthoniobacteraceae bacterium]